MTTREVVAHKGLVKCSAGLMQEHHGELFVPAANLRTHIIGTMQRPPYPFPSFKEWLEYLQKNKGKDEVFAILAHEGQGETLTYRYVGHMGIHGIKWPDGVGTTGSMIIDPELQGAGIGTEAKLLLLYHCFYVLGLNNVKSAVKGWNAKSAGHLLKCGYRMVGRFERIIFHEGTFVDEIVFQVSKSDFEPIWKKYQETKELPKLTDEQRALVTKETNT